MRFLTVSLLALLGTTAAFAQDGDAAPIPDRAIAIGAGIAAPTGSLAPNTVSVRLRLADKIEIEPTLGLAISSSTQVVEVPDDETTNVTRNIGVGVGALGRFGVAQKESVELQALGGVGFNTGRTTNDPEGSDNNTTTGSVSVGASWGVGITWWASERFSLTADATNPLVSFARSKTEPESGDSSTTSTDFAFLVQFDPTVRMMGHVWF